jgi:hypothetical protein
MKYTNINIPYNRLVTTFTLPRATSLSFWWIWVLLISIVAIVVVITLEFAPFLFMDEFMNVDLGRTILNPYTDWSITWITEDSQPVFLITYLGPVLQYFAYQLGGEMGPRVFALAGAIVAATSAVAWLKIRGVTQSVAVILGLALLLDPMFVQAYTTARVDGWTMGLCFTSCFTIRYASQFTSNKARLLWLVSLSGGLASIALFMWPSAVFLFPLILLELIYLASKEINFIKNKPKIINLIFYFSLGGLISSIILLLPIATHVIAILDNILKALIINTEHGGEISHLSYTERFISSSIELIRVLKFSPFLFIAALLGLAKRKNLALALSTLLVIILMLSTVIYISRVQYLLPYFILLTGSLFINKTQSFRWRNWNYLLKPVAVLLIFLWSVGLTLFARTAVAFHAQEERSRQLVRDTAMSMLGEGKHKVALFYSFEFYYAGSTLGWKMYAPYKSAFADISTKKVEEILPLVDYAIIPKEQLNDDYVVALEKGGMYEKGEFLTYKNPVNKDYIRDHSKTTNLDRIQIVYRILRQPYGPYKLYERRNRLTVAVPDTTT